MKHGGANLQQPDSDKNHELTTKPATELTTKPITELTTEPNHTQMVGWSKKPFEYDDKRYHPEDDPFKRSGLILLFLLGGTFGVHFALSSL